MARNIWRPANGGMLLILDKSEIYRIMAKKDIHPEYYLKTLVKCSCGNTFTVGSTQKEIKVDICSKCHPFFTGDQKLIDTAGRVEKFKARKQKAAEAPVKKKKARSRKQEERVHTKKKK